MHLPIPARLFGMFLLGALMGSENGDLSSISDTSTEPGGKASLSGTSNLAGPFLHPVDRNVHAPLVALHSELGPLVYGLYRERGAPSSRNIVPDFSRAGYMGGGVALPMRESIPVRVVLAPGSGRDDHRRIQAAIDEVAGMSPDHRGLRGAVLLQRGRYALGKTLTFPIGGVVLRGEGRGSEGTVLRSTVSDRRGNIIDVGNEESRVPRPARDPRRTAISTPFVPVGAMRIEVESAAGYSVGDTVAIVREANAAWLGAEGIDTARYNWRIKDYQLHFERVVTAVEDDTLTLDAPVVDSIEARFGGGSVYRTDVDRAVQVGIEDLRLEGDPNTGTANGTPDIGPFTAIRFGGVRDSWIRNVTVRFVSHGFATRNGAHLNTFEDVAYIDPRFGETEGARRYVYLYEGNSAFNLTQRCYNGGGRHTFVIGAQVPGPNVFLDCVAEGDSNDSGPHHRWSTGVLYDNTRGFMLRAQQRRWSGSGHGWAGAQQMFWNTEHDVYVVQAPPFAMNWSVGQVGTVMPGKFPPEEPAGMIESPGRPVTPRSLYLQQLRDRLGEQAVLDVTTSEQRKGRIWASLSARAGE